MWPTLIPIIGELVLEGVKGWREERRTRFLDEYHDILRKITHYKNRTPEEWIDSDIDVSEQELADFLQAYNREVKSENSST